MSAPFKVKALYDYRSEEPDDLPFGNGQIITVTEADDADWYTGEYISSDGQQRQGIFPRNFVEKYEPPIPSRPVRAPRKAPPPEAASTEPAVSVLPERSDPPPASMTSGAQDVTREQEDEPTPEIAVSKSVEQVRPMAAAEDEKPSPAMKKAPMVVEKPTTSSFKDRIAAFNKPAAPAPAPFKPTGGTASSFVKKPFVAPPPSRNAFVPPPRDTPAPKVYHREEEMQVEEQEQEPVQQLPVSSYDEPTQEEDQPKPTSLKERIALLQKQQQEQAARSMDSARKKDKPRRPEPPRTESADATETQQHASERAITTVDAPIERVASHETQHTEVGSGLSTTLITPPAPARELVSDTNDADDSGAADTEDARDESTEEERVLSRTDKARVAAMQPPRHTATDNNADGENETEEEDEDSEIRRKRELRERMAKMSGGMGMMGMLGGPLPTVRKSKPVRDEPVQTEAPQEELAYAPPVPVMALPGMTNMRSPPRPATEPEIDDNVSQVTPSALNEPHAPVQDDYISQGLTRSTTTKSNSASIFDRPPPGPIQDLPQSPQSSSARPVPPPPPPTKMPGELPVAESSSYEVDPVDQNTHAPQLPMRAPSAKAVTSRAVPPPLPPITHEMEAQAPQGAPPVPMSPTSSQSRAPPPPPPGHLPPRRTDTHQSVASRPHPDSEEEVTEYDGDYDTDIASGAPHKDALKSHNRESSVEEETLSGDERVRPSSSPPARAPPPPIPSAMPHDLAPQIPSTAFTDIPRGAPPPPPQNGGVPRDSVDAPRIAPPPLPPSHLPPQSVPLSRESMDTSGPAPPLPSSQPPPPRQSREEYDPYRYSMPPQEPPGMAAYSRHNTTDFEEHPPETSPIERSRPPPPSSAAPPATYQQDPMSTTGGLVASKQATDLARTGTVSRRSMEAPRMGDQGFIASDLDLAQSSQWWTKENNPPPSILSRPDVLWEEESSVSQKRGGRTTVSRDVYVLYQDYSQTSINATFDSAEPAHATLEQSHERPPNPPRKDQLESASDTFGVAIAQTASKSSNNTVGEGSPADFVSALIRAQPAALLPVGTKSYGALIYANLANASTMQHDEIRPGDIVTFRNAKFSGHKGGLHQKYSLEVGRPGQDHVAVVAEWDGTKKKIRAWEQTGEKGKKAKVREESYRVADLKSGEVRVWRVMPRSWVNWGTA